MRPLSPRDGRRRFLTLHRGEVAVLWALGLLPVMEWEPTESFTYLAGSVYYRLLYIWYWHTLPYY